MPQQRPPFRRTTRLRLRTPTAEPRRNLDEILRRIRNIRRDTLVALIFLAIAAASFLGSYATYPGHEPLSSLKPSFDLGVSALKGFKPPEKGSYGIALPLSRLGYSEEHYDQRVDLNISLRWSEFMTRDSIPVEVSIELPNTGGVIESCEYDTWADLTFKLDYTALSDKHCYVDEVDPQAAVDKVRLHDSMLYVRPDLPPRDYSMSIHVVLRNLAGIGFNATRSRVEAHLPTVGLMSDERSGDTGLDIEVNYYVPHANLFDWYALEQSANSIDSDEIAWTYPWSGNVPDESRDSRAATRARAVREDVAESDADAVFLAGSLVGIGGGALVAALQFWFESSRRPRRL